MRARAELERPDVGATGPSWARRGWLPSWRAIIGAELVLSDVGAPA